IKFNSKKGFFFETDVGDPLNLTQLSSGEQHQIVLLYELIFKANENVLVLIDEPELSLHVAWQKEFLNDLTKIIEIQNMPIVIATHSPQIIDSKWDLTVDLEAV
ncbi:AAA family ATPase, partial [Acinetobacter baumannii]|nr:AAA family ATPase [Acinetobacter baumannii]